jgi:hypothetical protein
MSTERGVRDVGVIEIMRGVVSHAKAVHDRARARVVLAGEGHQLVDAELVERERRGGACRFGCEAKSPCGP